MSAQVFELAFERAVRGVLELESRSLTDFLDVVLGRSGRPGEMPAARAFKEATSSYNWISVDYQGLVFLPQLVRLRNLSGARTRFVVIAHSPGAYGLDWALLRPLLRAGDRIIAPTHSAQQIIGALCPDLTQYVRVVPHPIGALGPAMPPEPRLLVLGRLVHEKAIHRALDAHARLRGRGYDLMLDLAGPLTSPDSTSESVYVRSLRARIERLGLADRVRFHGTVHGREKARLLAGARLIINLSTSLEESFGKTVAEGLAVGVPSVVTMWDGLPEVAGAVGITVPVEERRFAMDVDPERIAAALEAVLAHPPEPVACRDSARRFDPDRVGARYAHVLGEAVKDLDQYGTEAAEPHPGEPAAPAQGLLSNAAPLTAYSWAELFDAVVEEGRAWREILSGAPPGPLCEAGQVRTRVFYALRRPIECLMANTRAEPLTVRSDQPASRVDATVPRSFLERIEAAASQTGASRASRVVCLDLLHAHGRTEALENGLEALRADGFDSPGMEYLEVESLASRSVHQALARCDRVEGPGWWDEHAAHRLRQLSRLAVIAGRPDSALPRLRRWTADYPDEGNAGEVRLARALCASRAGLVDEAAASLQSASRLLGSDDRVARAIDILSAQVAIA